MSYRQTQVEVTPGVKQPDNFVTKKLAKTQQDALDCLAANELKGDTFTDYSGKGNCERIGLGLHNIRVSTERYLRYSGDGLHSASKSTMKPLEAAGLVIRYGSKYSPDYTITEAGILAAKDGEYQKKVDGTWTVPTYRPMTADEQKASDIDWLTDQIARHCASAITRANDTAKRLEDVAAEIRRDADNFNPAFARRYGSDDLNFSNSIISRVLQTVSSVRFDVMSTSESNMLTAIVRLDTLEGTNTD